MIKHYRNLTSLLLCLVLLVTAVSNDSFGGSRSVLAVTTGSAIQSPEPESTEIADSTNEPGSTALPMETSSVKETASTNATSETQAPAPSEVANPGSEVTPTNAPETPAPSEVANPGSEETPTNAPETTNGKKSKIKAKLTNTPGKVRISWNTLDGQSVTRVFFKKTGETGVKKKKKDNKQSSVRITSGNNTYTPRIKEGEKYYFRVWQFNESGNVIGKSNPLKVCMPKKIDSITMTRSTFNKYTLSWKKVTGAKKYIIYKKDLGKNRVNFTKYKTIKKLEFSDSAAKYDKRVEYKIVSVQLFHGKRFYSDYKEKEVIIKSFVDTKDAIYNYSDMVGDLGAMLKYYPGSIHLDVIGQSEDGRNIYDVILGNIYASKSLLVVDSIHAREYMCSQLGMKQIEYYLQNPNEVVNGRKISSVLSGIQIHILTMANPDGVSISQMGPNCISNERLRNNLRIMSASSGTTMWKANARGVDLNRNFPYRFVKDGKRGSSDFSGEKAASEVETKAIIQLTKSLKKEHGLKGIVNYHSMGNIIFGDAKGNGDLHNYTTAMYDAAISLTEYASADSYYSPSGGRGNYREYVMYGLKLPSITIEIGSVTCPLPASEFKPVWKANRDVLIAEAALFL